MKRIISILIIICTMAFGYNLYAQSAYLQLGYSYANEGNYEKAIDYANKAYEMASSFSGNEYDILICKSAIAYFYALAGKYNMGLPLYQEVYDEFRAHDEYISNYPDDYLTIISSYGASLIGVAEYAMSIPILEEGIRCMDELLDSYDSDRFIMLYNNLSIAYRMTGDFTNAINANLKALDILYSFNETNENDSLLSRLLSNLGLCYHELGKYEDAIKAYQQGLQHTTDGEFNSAMSRAHHLVNLSITCRMIGDTSNAINYANQGVAIFELWNQVTSPNYATALCNAADCYYKGGNLDEAIALNLKGLSLRMNSLGNNHPEVLKTKFNLAQCYLSSGNYSEGKHLIDGILEDDNGLFNQNPAQYCDFLTTAALFSDSKNSVRYKERALDIYMNIYGRYHDKISIILADLCWDYANEGTWVVGIEKLKDAFEILKNRIAYNYSYLTTSEREFWWRRFGWSFSSAMMLYFSQQNNNSEINSLCYDWLLLSKGILLSTENQISNYINSCGDPIIVDKLQTLQSVRKKIIALESLNESCVEEINNLQEYSLALERDIMSTISDYRKLCQDYAISWNDIRDKLDSDDIAIEIYECPEFDNSKTYYALAIDANSTIPLVFPLFNEKSLDNIDPNSSNYTSTLFELFWNPICSNLTLGKNIYISPIGKLMTIPFESAVNTEGTPVDEVLNIYRVSSTRYLLNKGAQNNLRGMALYGGLDYDSEYNVDGYSAVHRVLDIDFNKIRDTRGLMKSLPSSLLEVETIYEMVRAGNIMNCIIYTGKEGTEESFYGLDSLEISHLHLATHGFYYDNEYILDNFEDGNRLRFIRETESDDNTSNLTLEDKAMTHSGLIFAGANRLFKGLSIPLGREDGVLTAQEISTTNFSDLELVVLSSCDSGLGDINYEGVYGIQRGFKKAGVKTILMSLWEVDDYATSLLMQKFYEVYLTQNYSTIECLKIAKDFIRNYSTQYSNPYYWAGWILLDALN